MSFDNKGSVAAADMQLAKQLAFTCHQMYATTATGLAPEHTVFRSGTMSVGCVRCVAAVCVARGTVCRDIPGDAHCRCCIVWCGVERGTRVRVGVRRTICARVFGVRFWLLGVVFLFLFVLFVQLVRLVVLVEMKQHDACAEAF